MELDEAIVHAREVAEEKRNDYERACALNVPSEGFCECAAEQEQLAEWLTELQERREADRWIPVTERLPEDTEDVLVYDGQDMFVAWCGSYNRWHSSDDKLDKNTPITHWKPLPKPYESEDE